MIKGLIIDFNRTIYDAENKKLMDGALSMLEKAKSKGLKMCLISKTQTRDRKQEITDLGLDIYFDEILVVEGSKTQDHFLQCFEEMGLEPYEIAVIGDRVAGEIALGNYFGCKTIWYRRGKFASEKPREQLQEPDYIISELGDVFKFIKEKQK